MSLIQIQYKPGLGKITIFKKITNRIINFNQIFSVASIRRCPDGMDQGFVNLCNKPATLRYDIKRDPLYIEIE